MKAYCVTAMFEGKLESWVTYDESVSAVKKRITNHWNKNMVYGAKIIRVEPATDDQVRMAECSTRQ